MTPPALAIDKHADSVAPNSGACPSEKLAAELGYATDAECCRHHSFWLVPKHSLVPGLDLGMFKLALIRFCIRATSLKHTILKEKLMAQCSESTYHISSDEVIIVDLHWAMITKV